jgi:DNA-binding NarL/FixJ family response regulator
MPTIMAAKIKSSAKQLLIVDDHPMMRTGLAQLIDNEPDLVVAAGADTAREAQEAVLKHKLDLVLLDISLPDKNGLELIKDIRAQKPELAILVVSMHDETLYAERVLRAGARGYIMKQEGGKRFLEAIRRVLEGGIYVSEKMSARILEIFSGHPSRGTPSPLACLSDREFEVFQAIARGSDTAAIARQLHVSVKTVEAHRVHIKEKLQLKTANDLVRFAVRWIEAEGKV